MANSPEAGRTVTSRALAIVGAFSPGRPRMTLAEICRATGLRHATAHRLVAELTEWGALEREPTTGHYVVGLRLWELGTLNPRGQPLRQRAMPVMEHLYDATQQHVQLAVLDGLEAVIVERISAPSAVAVVSQVGGRLPLHASAVGKVLLAHGPDTLLDEILRTGLKRYTSSTITNERDLRMSLAECRRSGVAIVREEMSPHAYSVAAPVYEGGGQVVAALSVVSSEPETHRLAPAVLVAARTVSRGQPGGRTGRPS